MNNEQPEPAPARTQEHTPGPWTAMHDTICNRHGVLAELSSDGCGYRDDISCDEEFAANARLIAAAPETAAQRDALLRERDELLAYTEGTVALLEYARGIADLIRNGKPSAHLWNYCVMHSPAAIARAEIEVQR